MSCQIVEVPDLMYWALTVAVSQSLLVQVAFAILMASSRSMPKVLPVTRSFKEGMLLSGVT